MCGVTLWTGIMFVHSLHGTYQLGIHRSAESKLLQHNSLSKEYITCNITLYNYILYICEFCLDYWFLYDVQMFNLVFAWAGAWTMHLLHKEQYQPVNLHAHIVHKEQYELVHTHSTCIKNSINLYAHILHKEQHQPVSTSINPYAHRMSSNRSPNVALMLHLTAYSWEWNKNSIGIKAQWQWIALESLSRISLKNRWHACMSSVWVLYWLQ